MTAAGGRTAPQAMTCDAVAELAGLYVLDALEPSEREAVAAHLATCERAHEEVRELGGVVPALASLVEPLDAPPQLKARVLAAVSREASATANTAQPWTWTDVTTPSVQGAAASRGRAPVWASWAAALASVVIVALVGAWAIGVQSRAEQADQRARVLANAITAFGAPDSSVAVVRGSGAHAGASGFAAFSADGKGYLVMVGLPAAPTDRVYQAWYIADGRPASAGLVAVDPDGYAVMVDPQPRAGTEVVALTIEPAGGSALPTTEPFAAGEVRAPSA